MGRWGDEEEANHENCIFQVPLPTTFQYVLANE